MARHPEISKAFHGKFNRTPFNYGSVKHDNPEMDKKGILREKIRKAQKVFLAEGGVITVQDVRRYDDVFNSYDAQFKNMGCVYS